MGASTNGLAQLIRPYHVTAADTTAPGDAFNGAFATALLDMQVESAAQFASAATAISVTRRGAQHSSLAGMKGSA